MVLRVTLEDEKGRVTSVYRKSIPQLARGRNKKKSRGIEGFFLG